MPLAGWKPPDTITSARQRRRVLIGEIEDIETQLGDRRKRTTMSRAEWEDWYQSAKWARVSRLQQLRELNDWIHEYQVTTPATAQ